VTAVPRRRLPRTPVPAVSALIVDGDKILLIRRGSAPAIGKWAAPGGAVELGETAEQAVKREVFEETGLEIEVGKIAGLSDIIVTDEDNGRIRYHYFLVSFFATAVGGQLTASSDAVEARWVPLSEVRGYDVTKTLIARLEENGLI